MKLKSYSKITYVVLCSCIISWYDILQFVVKAIPISLDCKMLMDEYMLLVRQLNIKCAFHNFQSGSVFKHEQALN